MSTAAAFVVASPELIRRNMQEVLDSVQKIHKQRHKHRKKKRNDSIKDSSSTSLGITEQKSPLKEITKNKSKSNRSEESSKTPSKTSSILNHFPVSRKSNGDGENSAAFNTPDEGSKPKKSNAFEILMSARSRTVSDSTPGKIPIASELEDSEETEEKKQNVKRKLMLQEWNEKKGGKKRKLEDDKRDDYISHQMDKRAKRLKKLLTSAISPKSSNESPEVVEKKKMPQRKRVTRLSSVEIDEDVETNANEDKEFQSKLNSPIKKRDSLLGYFPKVQSPTEQVNSSVTSTAPTPKRRSLRKKNSVEVEQISTPTTEKKEDTPVSESGSRRPRRTCTLQVKNDTHEQLSSPEKESKDCSIIEINENTDEEYVNEESTPNRKLAPMFIKTLPKPAIDPEVAKAKQEFLMSGVPNKIQRDMEKQKKHVEKYETCVDIFPKISHVTQDSEETPIVNLSTILNFIKETKDNISKTGKKYEKITDCKKQDFKKKPSIPKSFEVLEEIANKRDIIKNWKMHFDRFPTFKCYNQMREKYRFHSAIDSTLDTQEISESFVVTRKSVQKQHAELTNEDEKPPPSAPNGELLFTDKYKPLLIEQVLVNLTPVNSLKEFLSSWSIPGQAGNYSGYTSEESNSSQSNTNSVVLLGPKSSGKSNAVFALANEMNFNVLEINAGMKRSGKKLLSDLHEATQSHQIRKKQKDVLSAKTLLKKSLSNSNADIMKMSLILIEDADIIFDNHDAGFVDAIYTLASTSKRPLIIIAEDINCPHLQRLIKQNSIVFNPPNPISISKFLSVLALLENCPIDLNQLLNMYIFNRKDLRKTINEMQFFIQSGGDKDRSEKSSSSKYFAIPPKKKSEFLTEMPNDTLYMHKEFFEFYTNCQSYPSNLIPYPINFSGLWMNMKELISKSSINSRFTKRKRRSKGSLVKPKDEELLAFSNFYENISVAESISFMETKNENRFYKQSLGEEIAHYIVDSSVKLNLNIQECPYNLYDDTQRECTSVLKSLQSTIYVKPSAQVSIDYEPCLRTICRSELYRQEGERKGSRFYHHLRFMSQNFSAVSNEFQKRVCTIFQENDNEEPALSQE